MSASLSLTRRWLGAAFACAVLAACSSDPVERDTFYRLGAPATPAARAGGPLPGTVEIAPFRAAGIVNERAILYRDGPSKLAQYTYHAWAEPPAVMLQRSLIATLRNAQAFQSVVSPDMRLDRDYELRGDLKQWEHVRGGAAGSTAIEIEISLRRVRDNQLLLLKTYHVDTPADGISVDSAVASFTRGLDQVYVQALADLAGVTTAAAK